LTQRAIAVAIGNLYCVNVCSESAVADPIRVPGSFLKTAPGLFLAQLAPVMAGVQKRRGQSLNSIDLMRAEVAHWEHRSEAAWQKFKFNQPYEKGLKRLKEDVLSNPDYDPATLWQWGTLHAMAVIEVLKDCEKQFGAEGQKLVCETLRRVGLDVGRQILKGTTKPDDMTEVEFLSFFMTVINRIVWACLEAPKIDSEGQCSVDILWCPHQDHYGAFDCRVQRYFVVGIFDALEEFGRGQGFQMRFDTTIPANGGTCHFTAWHTGETENQEWNDGTQRIELKALKKIAERE
jgi:hypothetical protein